jgi:histidinol-phosphate/aromatic aminotransferase/cobyric acid decarboxylase-like protein
MPYLPEFELTVVDESFMDFLPPTEQQSLIPVMGEYPNLVVLRSLTKFYSLPGLRLGYCIAHPDRIRRWKSWRDPWPVNALAAAAAIAVLPDLQFQQMTWDWLRPARDRLYAGLNQISGLHPYPGAANFLLVKSARSCTELQAELLKHHQILIRDCISFPELGDRFFRVAVRTDAETDRLLAGLEQVIDRLDLLRES